jgi:YHS domain-containing protein
MLSAASGSRADGRLYYFVSEDHERRFLAAPEEYLEGAQEKAPTPERESPEAEGHGGHQHP